MVSAAQPGTVRALWAACRDALAAAGIENAAAEADWLWQAAVGGDRHLFRPEDTVPLPRAEVLRCLTARRAAHEPLQYLLGSWPFLNFEVQVCPGVLIPRQDTECVAEEAIRQGRLLQAQGLLPTAAPDAGAGGQSMPEDAADAGAGLCLDVCAGSGVLALALAVNLRVPVTAVELSAAALPCLQANAAQVCAQFAAPPVRVVQQDLFAYWQTLAPASVALLVSNPPYLTEEELQSLQPEVEHEPTLALDGGPDGLRFYRCLAQDYRACMQPGGAMVLEIGAQQGAAVCSLLQAAGWRQVRVLRDLAGHDRCICALR